MVRHTEGVRKMPGPIRKPRCHCRGAQKEMCATAMGASFSRQDTTYPLLHKFQVQLLLPSWTPEVAGTAALCPWEYAQGQAPEHCYKSDCGQHMLRKETASFQIKNSSHAKNVLNPHKLHRDTHAYKQLPKTTVDNCFP